MKESIGSPHKLRKCSLGLCMKAKHVLPGLLVEHNAVANGAPHGTLKSLGPKGGEEARMHQVQLCNGLVNLRVQLRH